MVSYIDFDWAAAPCNSIWTVAAVGGAYLLVVGTLDALKPSWQLERLQTVHNLILSFGSLIMFVGTTIELLRRTSREGPAWIVCEDPTTEPKGPLFFWSYMYFLSKFYELLDTVLQMLKGRRPPHYFLHVYHHVVVMFTTWGWLEYGMTLQYIGMLWNTFVHVVMYYYYYLKSQGISPWWKRHITQLQIAQFVCSGIFFLVLMYCVHGRGQSCKGLRWAYLSTAFNMTLLVQFVGVLRTPPRKMEKGG